MSHCKIKPFFLVVFYSCCVTPGFIGSFESFCNFDNVLLHCVEYKVERERRTNCLENHKDRRTELEEKLWHGLDQVYQPSIRTDTDIWHICDNTYWGEIFILISSAKLIQIFLLLQKVLTFIMYGPPTSNFPL